MRRTLLVALIAIADMGMSQGVPPGFSIKIDPIVEGPAAPGSTARVALRVSLPEGFHIQSNQPRDPTLIPTVLSIDPPPSVTALEVVFPKAIDFEQKGGAQPLAVFEREFLIGARFGLDARQPPGDIVISGRLRYQACDDRVCYRPMTADVSWTVRVVPKSGRAATEPGDVFNQIAFGRGQPPPRMAPAPAATASPPSTSAVPAGARPAAGDALALLDRYTVLATEGGYNDVPAFMKFIR
ncbi:MAG: protein-disulfide reductase DsbD domain-containing protein, partial [Acidobacteriota bacterium]